MIDTGKTNTMYDIIHGTVTYSSIEYEIISTPIFNRLQRVSQSSLAFLTFPSNKVKRFEHSVGTMQLSGKMFYNSICNADKGVLEKFMSAIVEEIEGWRKNKNQSELPKELKNMTGDKILEIAPWPRCSFYNGYLPANLEEKQKFPYYVAFQAIRIAGLLHDVGHLPYSHILESAMKKLYIQAESNPNIVDEVKKEFLEIMSPFVTREQDALHEEFGKLLVDSIEQTIRDNMSLEELNKPSFFYFLLVFYFAKKILCSKFSDNSIFADMHLIVAGVVDSDRLDYCARDYYCAGFDKSIFDYNRFFQGYKLIYRRVDDDYCHFLFAPSAKNLLLIEELLRKRYRIYSDINYHHRVHKHEILLEDIICYLGIRELEDMKSVENLPAALPLEVSSIWKLVKELKNNMIWLEYQLIQMDDSWLDTVLKHKFFELYQSDYSSIQKYGKNVHWNQFDELISTRKHYFSLIKRACDFQRLDETFYKLVQAVDLDDPAVQSRIEDITNGEYNTFVSKTKSLFFNYCLNFILTKTSTDKWRKEYYEKVESVLNKNLPEHVLNFIIKSSRFSNGLNTVTAPVYLVGDVKRETRFDTLSFQRDSFLAEDALTPPFHLYYLPSYNALGVHNEVSETTLINHVANCLVEVFKNKLKEE